MKRTIVAFLAGVMLATAGSVYAEDIKTLIGKQIQGEIPVKINGEELDKKAIYVDGTSYLPVRAIGDALGMNVKFDADLGVELTPKEGEVVGTDSESPTEPKQMTPEDEQTISRSEQQIEEARERILRDKSRILDYEEEIKKEEEKLNAASDDVSKQLIQMNIDVIKTNIEAAKEGIAVDEKAIVDFQVYIEKIRKKYDQ